jgi:hypothetical protein
MAQNTSHAVMAQRAENRDSLDDFPTPPWATRAFVEHVLGGKASTGGLRVLEPACGRGYMSLALAEYFGSVISSDIHDYGFAETRDFLGDPRDKKSVDWMITNPPFKAAEAFVEEGLKVAKVGVAILTRTVFIESIGRYERLFSTRPPTLVAQYTERVPMVKGRLDKTASTATGYCWLVWGPLNNAGTELVWIPPCRKKLERHTDYSDSTDQLDLIEGKLGDGNS